MARFSDLNGLSGKMGRLVTYKWRGIDCVRTLPRKHKKTQSAEMINSKARFAYLNEALKEIEAFTTVGLRDYKPAWTARNAAISLNSKHLTGDAPCYSFDYSRLTLSAGKLPGVKSAQVVLADNRTLNFNWQPGTTAGRAADRAMVIAWSPELKAAITDTSADNRHTGSCTLQLPAAFVNTVIHVWIAFGAANGAMVSDGEYLGEITV